MRDQAGESEHGGAAVRDLDLGVVLGRVRVRIRVRVRAMVMVRVGHSRSTSCARSFMVTTWKSLMRWKVITGRSSKA